MQLHAQYYYQQLPPQERAAYHGMLTCLRELTPSARIPRLPMETLSTLFFQLRLDHPEIFYAVGFRAARCRRPAFVEFWPEYRFEKKRIREHRPGDRGARYAPLRPRAVFRRRSRSARSMISSWKTSAMISSKSRIRTKSSAR